MQWLVVLIENVLFVLSGELEILQGATVHLSERCGMKCFVNPNRLDTVSHT